MGGKESYLLRIAVLERCYEDAFAWLKEHPSLAEARNGIGENENQGITEYLREFQKDEWLPISTKCAPGSRLERTPGAACHDY